MSGKSLVVLALIAAAGYGLQRQSPPDVQEAGLGSRLGFGVGRVGSKMIGKWVTGMTLSTEQSLADLHTNIKKAQAGDGIRAREYAHRAEVADSSAVIDLQYGRPLKALMGAMDGKSMLNAVRDQLNHTI